MNNWFTQRDDQHGEEVWMASRSGEIVGRTGMTGEATQVKVRVNDAPNPRDVGASSINVVEPIESAIF